MPCRGAPAVLRRSSRPHPRGRERTRGPGERRRRSPCLPANPLRLARPEGRAVGAHGTTRVEDLRHCAVSRRSKQAPITIPASRPSTSSGGTSPVLGTTYCVMRPFVPREAGRGPPIPTCRPPPFHSLSTAAAHCGAHESPATRASSARLHGNPDTQDHRSRCVRVRPGASGCVRRSASRGRPPHYAATDGT